MYHKFNYNTYLRRSKEIHTLKHLNYSGIDIRKSWKTNCFEYFQKLEGWKIINQAFLTLKLLQLFGKVNIYWRVNDLAHSH